MENLKYLPSRYQITQTSAYQEKMNTYEQLLEIERTEFKQRWQELGLDVFSEAN
ncbi:MULTISPECIES: hypothetical protein [Aliiglaciecola]|uniref:hypothetical protein n=1 Tax=Aliiglaciecola TaxID=1406885 RepID=UPI001C0806F5|nr:MULTISPECIES: hypothetical protein [Aliiglaciecola]MBU2878059.1 hypothetical protein [Aliiglaciecola lipolytica]MDO6709424.1 hypothetical protein [Aliiglaciecola sp. 2_MG-2023]MDO6750572.1 hypothetical protein [Aliiglaciecola sp. 1_MG-2023]